MGTLTPLSHITDLHKLSDADVKQFAKELPGIVASLRLAAKSAAAEGMALSEVFPTIMFDSALKNEVVLSANGVEKHRVSGEDMVRAEKTEWGSFELHADRIRKARDASSSGGRGAPGGGPR